MSGGVLAEELVKRFGDFLALKGVDFAGAGSAFPPDTHGAVGIVDYLQIVNTRLRAYRTSDNALVRDQNLAAFFGPNIIAHLQSTNGDFTMGLTGIALILVLSAGLALSVSRELEPLGTDRI